MASLICAQLLFLESQDPEKEISLYINSPGGSVTAGMAIYDTMQFVAPPVATLCIGQAASMGAFLLAGGAKGMRYAIEEDFETMGYLSQLYIPMGETEKARELLEKMAVMEPHVTSKFLTLANRCV